MRTLCAFMLSAVSLFGQGLNSFGFRSPESLMSAYAPLTSNQIYALGPKGWWMANVGVYTNGTTVPDDGGKVQIWSDVSGNGYNLVMSSLANRPTYRSNYLNGLPGIDFGTASVLPMTNRVFVNFGPPFFVFGVYSCSNASGAAAHYIFSSRDGGSSLHRLGYPAGVANQLNWDGVTYAKGLAINMDMVFCAITTSNSGPVQTSMLYLNQKKVLTLAPGNFGTNRWNSMVVGGRDDGGALQLLGRICELIVFCEVMLNEDSRIGIELYLIKKYALKFPF